MAISNSKVLNLKDKNRSLYRVTRARQKRMEDLEKVSPGISYSLIVAVADEEFCC